jgi:hypothetical protein
VAFAGASLVALSLLAAWLCVPAFTPLAFRYLRLSLASTWRLMLGAPRRRRAAAVTSVGPDLRFEGCWTRARPRGWGRMHTHKQSNKHAHTHTHTHTRKNTTHAQTTHNTQHTTPHPFAGLRSVWLTLLISVLDTAMLALWGFAVLFRSGLLGLVTLLSVAALGTAVSVVLYWAAATHLRAAVLRVHGFALAAASLPGACVLLLVASYFDAGAGAGALAGTLAVTALLGARRFVVGLLAFQTLPARETTSVWQARAPAAGAGASLLLRAVPTATLAADAAAVAASSASKPQSLIPTAHITHTHTNTHTLHTLARAAGAERAVWQSGHGAGAGGGLPPRRRRQPTQQ